MTEMLTQFLSAGLIERIDGDDTRFIKMEKAAKAIAQELRAAPQRLIGAILAGLDPDVAASDPAIIRAEKALTAEWNTMRSVHADSPIGLLRAILLDACDQVAQGKRAAIVWLTAADTLSLMRPGREGSAVRSMVERWAERTEEVALTLPSIAPSSDAAQATLSAELPADLAAPTAREVSRPDLLLRLAAATGPNYRNEKQKPLKAPNPHWTNEAGTWSWEFADRMHVLLADEFDALARDVTKQQNDFGARLKFAHNALAKAFSSALDSQQRWMREALSASEARKQSDELRLNVLWWSEAMYSRSLRCGYRELPSPLASVVMAVDLLQEVPKPTPASVGYLLAEAVHRLPGAEFDRERTVPELLQALNEARDRLPKEWLKRVSLPTSEGRMSLRDLVFAALATPNWSFESCIERTGLRSDIALSLPVFARAMFRQEQAVQLAGSLR